MISSLIVWGGFGLLVAMCLFAAWDHERLRRPHEDD